MRLERKYEKKTIGTQHAATIFQSPELSYVHVDKYIVYGEIFVKTFSHWKEIHHEKTGRENIDWIVNIANKNEFIKKLQDRLEKKHSKRKYNVLLCFPGGRKLNRIEQWKLHIYDGEAPTVAWLLRVIRSVHVRQPVHVVFIDLLDYVEELQTWRGQPQAIEKWLKRLRTIA